MIAIFVHIDSLAALVVLAVTGVVIAIYFRRKRERREADRRGFPVVMDGQQSPPADTPRPPES
ncbi:MAG TPA: hypothetical protein VH475_16345 [Tepidisphaeraceae bacterium]